jgi:hypothetical protein
LLSEDEGLKPLDGLCVYDAIIMVQMIDKLLRGGLVTGREVGHVAVIRSKIVDAALRAGTNIEELGKSE